MYNCKMQTNMYKIMQLQNLQNKWSWPALHSLMEAWSAPTIFSTELPWAIRMQIVVAGGVLAQVTFF